MQRDMNHIVGTHDLLFVVLDSLRYDVAMSCLAAGRLPTLERHLPASGWEARHAPGNFTLASHQAFFAGFLPTPAAPGPHARLFALPFLGSTSIAPTTCCLQGANLVEGLANRGYHTACVGGVGFFNPAFPLGRVLSDLFMESHWSVDTGVTCQDSTAHQVQVARALLERVPQQQRSFLFLNISATHQPTHGYLPQGPERESCASQAAALAYVDSQLAPLFAASRARGPVFTIVCSDHGTCFGEDGFFGHRLCHPLVWSVPYAEFIL